MEVAVVSFQKALALKPDYAEAHNNLGFVLKGQGCLEEAVASYRKALDLKPDYAEAHSNLGSVFNELGRFDEAVTSLHQALAIKPDYAEAHNNLGIAFYDRKMLQEAVASYHKAIEIKPDFAEAHTNLGSVLQMQGNMDEAVKQIDLALSFKPDKSGWHIRKALLLPVIPASQEDIQTRRETLAKAVTALMDQNLTVPNAAADVGFTNFNLAYHSQNNRSLLQDIAKMHIAACPTLTYEAKHCQPHQRGDNDVLRIGFISAYLRNHTVGKL